MKKLFFSLLLVLVLTGCFPAREVYVLGQITKLDQWTDTEVIKVQFAVLEAKFLNGSPVDLGKDSYLTSISVGTGDLRIGDEVWFQCKVEASVDDKLYEDTCFLLDVDLK